MTASGNSQAVARTPAPETDPTLENAPDETGAVTLALLMELRTSCATEPDPMLINAGIGA